MELYAFASKYVISPGGVKVPILDRRMIQAKNKAEAFLHSCVLNRPAKFIYLVDNKKHWRNKLISSVNARAN